MSETNATTPVLTYSTTHSGGSAARRPPHHRLSQRLYMFSIEFAGETDWVIAESEEETKKILSDSGYSWVNEAEIRKLELNKILEFKHEEEVGFWIDAFGKGHIGGTLE